MTGLCDLIIEKRTNYIKNIEERIRKILSPDPFENFKKLMLAENIKEKNYSEDTAIIEAFINNSRENNYFKNLYEKIKNKPFKWETLKEIEEIAGITKVYHDSLQSSIAQTISVIDQLYAQFLESLKSFPKVYCSGKYPEGFSLEPNCVGANQIIAVLYSFEHNIDDLKFLEVYSSKRRDNLFEKLKEINKKKELEELIIPEKREELKMHLLDWMGFVKADFDTFSGVFQKEQLKNMILDQILSIEDFTHGAIRNNKTNEIYDYELERENYKGTIEMDIKEGLFYSTFLNMIQLMNNLKYEDKLIKEAFQKIYKKHEDSVLVNSIGFSLYFEDRKKSIEFFDKLKQIYGSLEELPAKYIVTDIFFNLNSKKNIKDKLNYLKERYILPQALEHISERYCHSDFLVELDRY